MCARECVCVCVCLKTNYFMDLYLFEVHKILAVY